MRFLLGAFLALVFVPCAALAQPFNVRAWYAQGQVFVVWQFPAPPAVPTDTVEIYASPAAQANTAFMQRVGRLFFPEYTGARLGELLAGSRLLVPTPAGGTYRLAADEGVFAFTPHAAGNQFFAVVDTGATVVGAVNSAATAFAFNPVADPIRAHPQFSGTTPGGNPYTAMVVWADGRDNFNDSRPDFPVIANANKNGVPHVFTISLPVNALPPEPLSCLFAIHGGGGEYQLFRPGIAARANMSLTLDDGIVVTPDDSVYTNVNGALSRDNTSWFGYDSAFDPFFAGVRTVPPTTALIVNYTSRRIHWIYDWLVGPNSPFTIDRTRVAMVGHSGGGRGTSHLTRFRPERFCAAVCYTPASDLSIDPGLLENFMRGNWDQNLATNLLAPDGVTPLGVTDVFTSTTRISPNQRDIAITRFFYGKRDEESAAGWSAGQRAVLDSLNDSRMGVMVSWDEREHGVELWNTETSDATDGHAGPWSDVGQWIAPVRTYRASGQYLVDAYRSNQSYPGFFNTDSDLILAGRQPDPGPGDPDLGDPYGTWGGYMDWDTATVVDDFSRWECTVFSVDNTVATIDDCPYSEVIADLVPRKTNAFLPPEGSQVRWTASDLASATVLQSGTVTAEAEGVVVVPALVVPRDTDRLRVVLSYCPSDFSHDGFVTGDDFDGFVLAFEAGDIIADFDQDGFVTGDDFDGYVLAFEAGC